jgi:dsRNA-specific ribonuclease
VEADLAELEAALGRHFVRPELLVHALTHRSLANERMASEQVPNGQIFASGMEEAAEAGDNERLEFLGDAVLGLVVAEALFLMHSEWQEGELTRVRSQLVSRKHMAEVAAAIDLGGHLRLSRGEDKSGLRRKMTVLSNTMEAVLGALFLDGGLEPVRAFVRRWVMGEAVEQLARSCAPGPRWETINRPCRSTCRPRALAPRSTASRAKAVPTTASAFWSRCGSNPRKESRESNWHAAWAALKKMPNRMRRSARWSG